VDERTAINERADAWERTEVEERAATYERTEKGERSVPAARLSAAVKPTAFFPFPRARCECRALDFSPAAGATFPAVARKPPNLRKTASKMRNCHQCAYVNRVTGRCRRYDYPVARDDVCDSFKPRLVHSGKPWRL
jgi:hypothetical protein